MRELTGEVETPYGWDLTREVESSHKLRHLMVTLPKRPDKTLKLIAQSLLPSEIAWLRVVSRRLYKLFWCRDLYSSTIVIKGRPKTLHVYHPAKSPRPAAYLLLLTNTIKVMQAQRDTAPVDIWEDAHTMHFLKTRQLPSDVSKTERDRIQHRAARFMWQQDHLVRVLPTGNKVVPAPLSNGV